jgi:hypothetical protein
VGAGVWLVLVWTSRGIPIVWDEGEYLFRADRVLSWFGLLLGLHHQQAGLTALSDRAIQDHWPFVNKVEGHPAWFVVPIALAKGLLSGWLRPPLVAARLGPITVFSVAAGAVAVRLQRAWGPLTAVAAAIAMLTLPRLFAEAHFATQDGQLTAWWLMLWAVDASPERGARTAVPSGVLLGLASATKFTGWLAAIPLLLAGLLRRPREIRRLCLVVPVAVLTFYVVNPPLWHAPIRRFSEHVHLNLNRPELNLPGLGDATLPAVWGGKQRAEFRVRDYVFGSMRHDGEHPYAPWYNAIVWWAVATPVLTLALGIIGVREGLRSGQRRARPSLLLLLNWATPMAARSLPGLAEYDGIRLMLPAFGFWCLFAGIGFECVWNRGSASVTWRPWRIRAGLLAAALATALNVGRYYPQLLSHYSLLVGGVRGAARLGFEPTYWWDAFDSDVLDWVNSHTRTSSAVAFSYPAEVDLALLRIWGRLQAQVADPEAGTAFEWYIVQNRSNALSEVDRALLCCAHPVYVKYAGRHARGVPVDLNVPLLLVFSSDQYWAAALGARNSGGSSVQRSRPR